MAVPPRTSGRPKSTGKITSGGINMACNVRATHNEHLRDPEIAAGYLSEALQIMGSDHGVRVDSNPHDLSRQDAGAGLGGDSGSHK
jgi:hypothetical protein